jgi:hypothetical protein
MSFLIWPSKFFRIKKKKILRPGSPDSDSFYLNYESLLIRSNQNNTIKFSISPERSIQLNYFSFPLLTTLKESQRCNIGRECCTYLRSIYAELNGIEHKSWVPHLVLFISRVEPNSVDEIEEHLLHSTLCAWAIFT